MMQSRLLLYFLLISLSINSFVQAKELISSQCEPLVEGTGVKQELRYSKGLLWKVSKGENNANYVFGTIHVSDPEVTTLPNVVDEALYESDQFVMEALPDAEQMLSLSQLMFFNDGRKLSEYLDEPIYNKTIEILSSYFLGSDSVSVMKPWAAFLMMNYPPDQGAALDLILLSIAQQNGASVSGLESLKEQGDIFNELTIDEQVKLLTDTVCHYDVVRQDFEVLKEFYLKQDLGGLYNHTRRFSTIEEPVYKKLMKKLITDRNITMVKRMQPTLEKGKSFIAIGAMHLSGEDGVLSLLEKQGYKVSVVY